jgi:hypothetical protein
MSNMMSLCLCDVKIRGLKFLNLVTEPAKVLSNIVNSNTQQNAMMEKKIKMAVNHLIAGKFNK